MLHLENLYLEELVNNFNLFIIFKFYTRKKIDTNIFNTFSINVFKTD